jgi:ribonuclease BN (tRNA processing enzyme)
MMSLRNNEQKGDLMKLVFLGVGVAFSSRQLYQSNMLLEIAQSDGSVKRLLIDAGGDIRHSLAEYGLNMLQLDAVYISHLHNDHIGGLEGVAFSNYFGKNKFRPKLFLHHSLIVPLWQESLRGGLESLQNQVATLETYFDVIPLQNNRPFSFGGKTFETVQTYHCMSGNVILPSFGIRFKNPTTSGNVFITTDTQYIPHLLVDFLRDSELIFHDCETSPFKSGVHAHYEELKELPAEIKQKMWLYHYSDGALPDAEADGFAGFVKPRQEFIFGA